MSQVTEALPYYAGESNRRNLFEQLRLGDVLGFAIFDDESLVAMARRLGTAQAIIEICAITSEGIPQEEMEYGTDFYFQPADTISLMPRIPGNFVSLTPDDATFLLTHTPPHLLDQP